MSAPRPPRSDRICHFTVASRPGNERLVIERVEQAVTGLGLDGRRTDGLKTAVAEAAMNAIEHGNHDEAEVPVEVDVYWSQGGVVISITDLGGGGPTLSEVPEPDLDLKLAGKQTPRGWGLFLIKSVVDSLWVTDRGRRHTVWLRMQVTPAPEAGR